MVVFKGSEPTDKHELSQMLRGVNGSFCFYDDCSLWEQCKMDSNRSFPLGLFLKRILK
jgi:hypothetical protein